MKWDVLTIGHGLAVEVSDEKAFSGGGEPEHWTSGSPSYQDVVMMTCLVARSLDLVDERRGKISIQLGAPPEAATDTLDGGANVGVAGSMATPEQGPGEEREIGGGVRQVSHDPAHAQPAQLAERR